MWGEGDAPRPLLLANDPKKTAECSARARSAAKTAIKIILGYEGAATSNTLLVLLSAFTCEMNFKISVLPS
jgi:hypothetical protein